MRRRLIPGGISRLARTPVLDSVVAHNLSEFRLASVCLSSDAKLHRCVTGPRYGWDCAASAAFPDDLRKDPLLPAQCVIGMMPGLHWKLIARAASGIALTFVCVTFCAYVGAVIWLVVHLNSSVCSDSVGNNRVSIDETHVVTERSFDCMLTSTPPIVTVRLTDLVRTSAGAGEDSPGVYVLGRYARGRPAISWTGPRSLELRQMCPEIDHREVRVADVTVTYRHNDAKTVANCPLRVPKG